VDVIKDTVIKTRVVSFQSDKFGRRKSFYFGGILSHQWQGER